MEIKDVQNTKIHERRNVRVNIRLTSSQNKFILDNNLSITKIMNEALKQLGYIQPQEEYGGDYSREENFRKIFKNKRGKSYKYKRRRH